MNAAAMAAAAGALLCATAAMAGQKLGQVQSERPPEQVYAVTCGYCHGANVGPIILGRNLPPEAIILMVRNGQNAMPAFRTTEISPQELDRLAAWIATSKARPKEKGQ